MVKMLNECIDIGGRIKQLRLEQDMSQKQLANISGYDQGTISHIERGIHSPTLFQIENIACSLGISTKDLIFGG